MSGRAARRSIPVGELHQVPEIAVEIAEHRDLAIRLDRGRADPFDAGRSESGEIAIEIIGGEEQEHAPARLIADEARLFGRGGDSLSYI